MKGYRDRRSLMLRLQTILEVDLSGRGTAKGLEAMSGKKKLHAATIRKRLEQQKIAQVLERSRHVGRSYAAALRPSPRDLGRAPAS